MNSDSSFPCTGAQGEDVVVDFRDQFYKWLVFNRRRYRRFLPLDSTFVVLGGEPVDGEKIPVLDLSMGGLAFVYHSYDGDNSMDDNRLSLLLGHNVYLRNLKYDIVSDEEFSDDSDFGKLLRRRSVRFKNLREYEGKQLKHFISKYTF